MKSAPLSGFGRRALAALVLPLALGVTSGPTPAAPSMERNSVAAAEPSGYWTGPVNSPVPLTISGGKVILNAHELRALIKRRGTVVVDVSNAPRRPEHLATGAPWLPLPHRAIPGSLWIPGVGVGEVPPAVDDFFRQRLAAATGGDPARRLVIYCHRMCWLSWNAAKRAIHYGYRHVYWFRDGIEGWQAAGLPTAVIEPQVAPEG
jgi:PQQ-dependent catabolism-associated CXXCW motif protein